MLDFLVTSGARRKLVSMLFDGATSGSLEELARTAVIGRASAHRELRAMQNLGLVVSGRQGGHEVFRASNTESAKLLRKLVKSAPEPMKLAKSARAELRTLGAPLWVKPRHVTDVEDALVRGVKEAHADPNLATVLPLSFVGAAERGLDPIRLLKLARDSGEKSAVGFFLDLTSLVTHDVRFNKWARAFRDRRCRAERPFFHGETRFTKMLAERNTPPVARDWGFRMNMPAEAFTDAYVKHRRA
jgi:hypothetical protein